MLQKRTLVPVLLAVAVSSTPAQAAEINFKLVNSSDQVITAVFVSRSRTPKWGPDLLRGAPLKPGGEIALSFSGDCGLYDLRLKAKKGVEFLADEEHFCADGDVVTVKDQALSKQSAH